MVLALVRMRAGSLWRRKAVGRGGWRGRPGCRCRRPSPGRYQCLRWQWWPRTGRRTSQR